MKTNKRFLILCLGMLTGWIACQKATTPTDNNGDDPTVSIQIVLTANPDTLKISTVKSSTIWAKVDSGGHLIADSTLVSFSSSLGQITSQAYTRDGRAETELTNTDTTTIGLCRVIGIVKNIEDTIYVLFKK